MTPEIREMRDAARRLFDAAVAAADPEAAIDRALAAAPLPKPAGRLHLVAIGKAAPAMMRAALRHVHGPHSALVVTHHENVQTVPGAEVLRAGHPVPDAAGLAAGRRVLARLAEAGPEDAVVALVSGGGSALVPAPAGEMTLEDKAEVNRLLLGAGLDITRMNLVRQRLSRLKGGGFLRAAAPAPVAAYLLSDVIGDDLRVIASGPTVGPIGTRSEARQLLQRRGLWERIPAAARDVLSAPDHDEPLPEATNRLVCSNRLSLEAMVAASGGTARIANDRLEGDVARAAAEIVARIEGATGAETLVFGGETTVNLTGSGLGGRNQELALRVALSAPHNAALDWVFLSGGTDGRDGPTDAAGGIVDAGTVARIRAAGGDPDGLLANNDSHAALKLAGDLLVTGATGTNVADVQVLILRPRTQAEAIR